MVAKSTPFARSECFKVIILIHAYLEKDYILTARMWYSKLYLLLDIYKNYITLTIINFQDSTINYPDREKQFHMPKLIKLVKTKPCTKSRRFGVSFFLCYLFRNYIIDHLSTAKATQQWIIGWLWMIVERATLWQHLICWKVQKKNHRKSHSREPVSRLRLEPPKYKYYTTTFGSTLSSICQIQ
jgi:hypothetical protein